MQPMSVAELERFVLSKPSFDAAGLIVAASDDKLLGFAHAGFGPNEKQSWLSTERGTTCLVMLRGDADAAIAGELLARSEAYLRSRGAQQVYGGGCYPLSPFYYGLYGGSEFSGILQSDVERTKIFEQHGYREARRTIVLERELAGFRPEIDRQQLQIRRHTVFESIPDPPTTSWWQACLFEPLDRTRGVLMSRGSCEPVASVNFWNMETMV